MNSQSTNERHNRYKIIAFCILYFVIVYGYMFSKNGSFDDITEEYVKKFWETNSTFITELMNRFNMKKKSSTIDIISDACWMFVSERGKILRFYRSPAQIGIWATAFFYKKTSKGLIRLISGFTQKYIENNDLFKN